MVSRDYSIVEVVHCALCVQELETNKIPLTPKQYAKVEVGLTPVGLQVWCLRHQVNIVHLDFGGQKLRANTHAKTETARPAAVGC